MFRTCTVFCLFFEGEFKFCNIQYASKKHLQLWKNLHTYNTCTLILLYIVIFLSLQRFHRLKKAVEYFKKFDTDQSGSIEKDEFNQLMLSIGCPKDKIPGALKALDQDGDGKISFPEFLKWLNWLPN